MASTNASQEDANSPSWWTKDHESGWQKMKHVLSEGWDGLTGQVKDGPPLDASFATAEPALRYGFGARHQFPNSEFGQIESRLEKEWAGLGPGRDWSSARTDIQKGWDSHSRHITSSRSDTAVRGVGSGFGGNSAGDSGSGSGD